MKPWALFPQTKESFASYEEDFLLALAEIELQVRAKNMLKRMLREAKFPLMKTFEMFDFDAAPGLDKRQLREIESGEYIRNNKNIIVLGENGTGKTYLANSLGVVSCKQSVSARFVTG